jgi:hypothetical protein
MRMAGLTMIMIVLAFKCLRFSGLARFRLLPGGGVLRIVYCVAFCCVIQVISLSGAAVAADDERHGKNGDFRHVPQTISLRDVAVGVKWGKAGERSMQHRQGSDQNCGARSPVPTSFVTIELIRPMP